MKFGNPERFAIEFEFAEQSGGLWMNGRSCYWIGGERVGDFEIVDSLRDNYFGWRYMTYLKDRASEDISGLSTQELAATLYGGLYNSGLDSMESDHQRGIDGQWERHDINMSSLCPVALIGWKVFLVNAGSKDRCIYARSEDILTKAKEQVLDAGEFDRVLDDVVGYLGKEYERLGGVN